jgi:ketosteroid isomerase-like protein
MKVGIEENKALVGAFYERLSASEHEEAVDLLDDDATWWIAGSTDRVPVAGVRSKLEFAALLDRMSRATADGVRIEIQGMVAEEDRVAVETQAYTGGETRRLLNEAHTVFEVRNAKIQSAREYVETV